MSATKPSDLNLIMAKDAAASCAFGLAAAARWLLC
jgi:hypothetical protein